MTDLTANTRETGTQVLSPPRRPLRVVLPGGAGHLGRILAGHLYSKSNAVTGLSRSGAVEPWHVTSWNGTDLDDWTRELEGADVVTNLAGRSVNCGYNAGIGANFRIAGTNHGTARRSHQPRGFTRTILFTRWITWQSTKNSRDRLTWQAPIPCRTKNSCALSGMCGAAGWDLQPRTGCWRLGRYFFAQKRN